MSAKDYIRQGFGRSQMVTNMLLGDLEDADLLVRPVPGANHIAWQMGHVISACRHFGELTKPGSMPTLPDGFDEKYGKETAGNDNAEDFLPKADYLRLLDEQRQALLSLLDELTEEELENDAHESLKSICHTVADVFGLASDHEMMHSGQYSTVRRKLGKPVAF
jgi:uncharacterized damage-inducible protein DinB